MAIGDLLGSIGQGAGNVAASAADSAREAVLSQYPGYGSLWTYDADGLDLTDMGAFLLGAFAATLFWVVVK
ncbi:hypothetical protein [Paracoccus sp. TOH]|uniref:hypothetical protein n=1 Tax=Paracoccus sp. TOH TaxID=1263728 RepID=UPI0025B0B6D4|nr:hypothetical protein [Paracoccus sp. TOH]WJS83888.1 hypothetical protein NBE95_08945 [Paracoccus sp. TOH]